MNNKVFHIVLLLLSAFTSTFVIASDKTFVSKQMLLGQNSFSYLDEGEGQALIFLHGWSSNKYYWIEQLRDLSQNYRVILLDWRGQGESTGGQRPYQFSELVDDLKVFIDSLELSTKPVLIGHSMGGVQVMHYAADYPNDIGGIVSVDAPGQDNFVTGKIVYWAMLAAFKATSFLDDKTAISLHVPVNKYLFYSAEFAQKNEAHMAYWESQFTANKVDSLIHSLDALTYRERIAEKTPDVPALFVLGTEDRFISREQTEKYQSLFPGSLLKLLPGAGHMSSEEQPKLFNVFLREFLASIKRNQTYIGSR